MTLPKSTSGKALVADVQAYLYQTLGAHTRILHWPGATALPTSLHSAFDLYELQLFSKDILLTRCRSAGLPPLRTLRTQLDDLVRIADRPAVVAIDALTSFERRRLVEQKIPFIVPGNQLYLPTLGIDFREYFRQPRERLTSSFAPATQAIFIAALLRGQWREGWDPAKLSDELGYTAMTLTRAARELAAAGLVMVERKGRARQLHVRHSPAQAWQQTLPFLRTPVRRVELVDRAQLVEQVPAPLAGLSALASFCSAPAPEVPTHAISVTHWQRAGVHALPELVPGACRCEIWSYHPFRLHGREIVDPLSLTLSLLADPSEQVREQLDTLRNKFPWGDGARITSPAQDY